MICWLINMYLNWLLLLHSSHLYNFAVYIFRNIMGWEIFYKTFEWEICHAMHDNKYWNFCDAVMLMSFMVYNSFRHDFNILPSSVVAKKNFQHLACELNWNRKRSSSVWINKYFYIVGVDPEIVFIST